MTAPVREDRTQFLGGSDVGAVLGVDPYKTRLQLYEEKVGLVEPFEGNAHTKRGTRLEAIAAEEYAERNGVKLARVNTRLTHPRYPFITARIDRRVVGQQKLTEFKCPSLGSFSKIKREGLHEGYIAQMQTYLELTGYAEGDWGIFCADLWELIDFPVAHDAKLAASIIDRLVDFWENHIVPRVPPAADETDIERLEIARAEGTAKLFTVTDPAILEAIGNLRDAKLLASDAEQLADDAKAQLRELVGENFGIYAAPGLRLSYTQAKGRSSFDKKALAGAKPLDRLKVGVALTPLFNAKHTPTREEIEGAIAEVGKADIDLTQFEKLGAPYAVMKVTEVLHP